MLKPGEARTVTIVAGERSNTTGIQIAAGQTYRFEATGGWKDWFKDCGPEGYASTGWMFYLWPFQRWRRIPNARWFALIGEIGGDPASHFVIGAGCELTARHLGELTCFANDLSSRYGNNRGEVTLTVTRIA